MSMILNVLKRYVRDTSAAIIILFAIMVPMLVGSAGMALDFAQAYLVKQRLSQAIDAAALAATALVPGFEGDNESVKGSAVSSAPNALLLFNPAVVLAPVDGHPGLIAEEKLADISERAAGRPQEISPYHFVRPKLPPSIIFHGTNDDAVPFATVQLFQKAMSNAGNRCEMKAYEGQPHGFFNPGRGKGEPRAEANRRYHQTIRQLDEFLVSLGYLK